MNSNLAEVYSAYCSPQQTWARDLINSTTFRSENYERIIDAGCGTGEVTNILLERFPNAKEVFAFDKAEEMIEFARKRNNNPKISYSVGVVDDVNSLSSQRRGYSLFTSFLVLHWIQDQREALNTVKTTLAPGGEFLLLLGVKVPPAFLKITPTLSESSKWNGYLANFKPNWRFTPEWEVKNKWREEPASGYKQLCEDAHLNVIYSKVISANYHFAEDADCKGFIQTLLPSLSVIPQERAPEFMDEAFEVYKKHSERDEQGRLQWPSEFLAVHGYKQRSDEL